MKTISNTLSNEQRTELAFTRQSAIFDELYAANTIVGYKRDRVRAHVAQYLAPGSSILELNAGTGEDTLYFSSRQHHVHATDLSPGMLEQLRAKAAQQNITGITSEQCSYTQLEELKNKGPYDLIFSNFAGLNCTGALRQVLLSFKPLLKPNGTVTLVILPGFCLWELLMMFKGKVRTAFRRFRGAQGADAHIEGVHFKCWYYNPGYVINTLKNDYELLSLEGLCTLVPPSYIEHFAERHPRWYKILTGLEERLKTTWPWRSIGDYYIITLRLKPPQPTCT